MNNPHRQYLKTKIETASKEQIVLMLMDGVLRFSEQARKAIAEGNEEERHQKLVRCQDIIFELIAGIDREQGGEIAENLGRLYSYSIRSLVVANLDKNPEKIDEVQRIFREIREGWAGAMDSLRESATDTAGAPSPEPVAASVTGTDTPAPTPIRPKRVLDVRSSAQPTATRTRLSVQG